MDGVSYEAVQVEDPADKAQKFLASHHYLFYKLEQPSDYYIYTFDRGMLKKGELTSGEFVRLPHRPKSWPPPVTIRRAMAWSQGMPGVILSRTMHKSPGSHRLHGR